jgi:hypothetical protein
VLPDIRLLRPKQLFSAREETSFTPETLFLSIGIGQEEHVQDNAVLTFIHEGIHWRQFQGTTFGAFCNWIQLSQEVNVFKHLRDLPEPRRREIFRQRAAGVPILRVDDETALPDPPLAGADAGRDKLVLLRMIWYDHCFTYNFFRNSVELPYHPDPPEDIFASAIADAVISGRHWHPRWSGFEYEDMLRFYRFGKAGRKQALGRELGTKDLLEAAAMANEVLLAAFCEEKRFYLSDEGAARLKAEQGTANLDAHAKLDAHNELRPQSVFTAREALDREAFLADIEQRLPSSYGYALQVFFAGSGLEATRHESWLTALAAIDFSLNGPLPPMVLPGENPPVWDDVYPPTRFIKAALAVRKCGGIAPSCGHAEVLDFQNRLADATGLSNPNAYSGAGVFDAKLPDFQAFAQGPLWEDPRKNSLTYYDYQRWCQQRLWLKRSSDLGALVVPAFWIWKAMWTDQAVAASYIAGTLDMTPPIVFACDGEIEHPRGSTTEFGTWLAVSRATSYAALELMVGTGPPEFDGFPKALLENVDSAELIHTSIRQALGVSYDPWTG